MTPNYSAVLDFDYQLRRHVLKRNRAMFEQNIFHFSDFFLDKIDFNLDKIDFNLDKIDKIDIFSPPPPRVFGPGYGPAVLGLLTVWSGAVLEKMDEFLRRRRRQIDEDKIIKC